jgi:hypothetical protein
VQAVEKLIDKPVDVTVCCIMEYGAFMDFDVEDESGYVHTVAGLLLKAEASPGLLERLAVSLLPVCRASQPLDMSTLVWCAASTCDTLQPHMPQEGQRVRVYVRRVLREHGRINLSDTSAAAAAAELQQTIEDLLAAPEDDIVGHGALPVSPSSHFILDRKSGRIFTEHSHIALPDASAAEAAAGLRQAINGLMAAPNDAALSWARRWRFPCISMVLAT